MRRPQPLSRKQQSWLGGIAVALILFVWLIQPPDDFPVKKQISINEGDNLSAISEQLGANAAVKTPLLFNLLVRISGGSGQIKAGDYWFETRLNAWTVARRLVNGQFVLHPVKVTIPEGSTPAQVSKILRVKFTTLDADKLLALLSVRPAEIFPDTYFLPPELTAEKLVATFQKNFRRQTASLYGEVLLSGRRWEDILVMASLVEEEASNGATRAMIAGILWKRLDAKMPLQVDVARETYTARGLPKQAIVNPGLAAISAVIHPTKSDYWYYLSDKTGATHYAVTFAEHKQNKLKYLR